MTQVGEPTVGRAAFLLGLAGLLPQALAVALVVFAHFDRSDLSYLPALAGYALGVVYAAIILSFLGGIWWGYAMRRDTGQSQLAALAIAPSLVAMACVIVAVVDLPQRFSPWAPVILGSAILLTLPIDRHLVGTGEAPANWMRLRIPLSIGLGGLTIAVGVLLAV